MSSVTQSYELFYSCGGHGGPYWSMDEAISAAGSKLHGMPSMASVSVVERDPLGIGGYGRIVVKVHQKRHTTAAVEVL